MRIAIDARELRDQPTGVGRYVSELLAAWGRSPAAAAHEFVLCADAPVTLPGGAPPRVRVETRPGRGTRWQQLVLPRLLRTTGSDVLLAPGYTAPLASPVPVVVSVHDVSFMAHPEWFGWREGLRLRTLTRWSARRAERVLTCSEFSRREIVRLGGVPPSKIDVIHLGVSAVVAHEPAADAVGAAHPLEEALVLYVGSIFARRHIPELIAGFSRLSALAPRVRLEIVGANRSRPPLDLQALANRTVNPERIAFATYVPEERLRALYAGAGAFVFLSEYEGFGLTPLEALATGVPIVVLDTPVAREIYGPAACYVARPDPAAIAEALHRVLFDGSERGRLLAAAPTVLARYSWDTCAARTLQALLDAAA